MEDEVVQLGAWLSPYALRVKNALAENGVEYVYKEENLVDKSPLLLQMNHVHKKILILIHNGTPVCESLMVVEYIEEFRNKKSPMLPSNAYQRAQAKFWANYIDEKIFANAKAIWLKKGEEQESAKKEFIEGLKTMERELGDKTYFGCETFGFVDMALVTVSCWFHALETCENFDVEAECPKLMAWVNRCIERETVAESLPEPHKIYEFMLLQRFTAIMKPRTSREKARTKRKIRSRI